jgi:hypothetical protein
VRQGNNVIKTIKTHQKWRLALDSGALVWPGEHRERCRRDDVTQMLTGGVDLRAAVARHGQF